METNGITYFFEEVLPERHFQTRPWVGAVLSALAVGYDVHH